MLNKQRIEFTLDVIPPLSTAQSGKRTRVIKSKYGRMFAGMFKTKKCLAVDHLYLTHLKPHIPSRPLTGDLRLDAVFYYPYRKSEKKSIVRAGLVVPKNTKPDFDNLSKQFTDALTTIGIIEDDAKIFDGRIRKFYASAPKITVEIEEV